MGPPKTEAMMIRVRHARPRIKRFTAALSARFGQILINLCRNLNQFNQNRMLQLKRIYSRGQTIRTVSQPEGHLFGGGDTKTTLSPRTMMVPSFFVASVFVTSS